MRAYPNGTNQKRMKTNQFLAIAGACFVVAGLSAHAAPLNLNQISPATADFTALGLDVNYSYNSQSQSGVFAVSSPSNPSSAAAQAADLSNNAFHGAFSLTADLSLSHGAPVLTSGSFIISGPSGVLLRGNLLPAAFGYARHTVVTTSGEYDDFDFLINEHSLAGDPKEIAEFLKDVGPVGEIVVDAGFDYSSPNSYHSQIKTATQNLRGTRYAGFQGDWRASFANPLAAGSVDVMPAVSPAVVVSAPEPAIYPAAASLIALGTLMFFRRRPQSRP